MSVGMYRGNIERLTKQKADLEKKVSQEAKKIAKLYHEVTVIQRSITSSTNLSVLRSKQRQIESKQKVLAQSQKKAADLAMEIASKLADLNRNIQNLEKAENHEVVKRRNEELRNAKNVTKEIQKQANLHTEISKSPLVIDLSRLPSKIKVLFLAANPQDLKNQLRLDEEIRLITERVRASDYRDSVELISKWAVRPTDVLQALNEHKPHIVHFSGHGSDTGELVFLDINGNAKFVSKEAIVATMSTLADNIRVVVFNSCFSARQAEAVTRYIDAAIGMNTEIGDEAARVFAAQFYSAIGFGRSMRQAFDQAIAALMMEGISEDKVPELFMRDMVDANELILVKPTGIVE
jgi:hypothetical protein